MIGLKYFSMGIFDTNNHAFTETLADQGRSELNPLSQLSHLDNRLLDALVEATQRLVPISNEWGTLGRALILPPDTPAKTTLPMHLKEPLERFAVYLIKNSKMTTKVIVYALVILDRLARTHIPIVFETRNPQQRVLFSALYAAAKCLDYETAQLLCCVDDLFAKCEIQATEQQLVEWLGHDIYVFRSELIVCVAGLMSHSRIRSSQKKTDRLSGMMGRLLPTRKVAAAPHIAPADVSVKH